MYEFHLYVANRSQKTQSIIESIKLNICYQFNIQCSVNVISILENPLAAEVAKILVTPTLLKCSPPPPKRITGNLFDTEKINDILR